MKEIKISIPTWVEYILDHLQGNEFEAYIVGGCVRDSLLRRMPKDWDITTNAKPDEVIELFESLGWNVIKTGIKHGTVTVVINKIGYEITTYRLDGEYEDNRHPSNVKFTNSLREDLSRRDFTINAMAYNDKVGLVDYFNGLVDLENKIIRCVGKPEDRFNEDALRMLRAIRFSSQLGFDIEQNVVNNICDLSHNLKNISQERIRDELNKILISDNPVNGICHLVQSGLNNYIIPELNQCLKFEQHNFHHDKDVFMHTLSVIENVEPILELRLSALFHDIGKSQCLTIDETGIGHFIEHHKVGADITKEVLQRLKFDNKTIDKVSLLVYEHMLNTNMRSVGIKKLINRVGKNNINDLIKLAIADRKASAKEYRNYEDILELENKIYKILDSKQPFSLKDLNINGKDLIQLGYKQGKEIGDILNKLYEIVLEYPELNNKEDLINSIN